MKKQKKQFKGGEEMSWEDIIKISAQDAIDTITALKEMLPEIEENVRKFHSNEKVNSNELVKDSKEFNQRASELNKVIIQMAKKIV
tara:strand:- start:1514 stop:1771 length:258 start_codon:yes stop_codon:yes gene_type:complete